MAPRVRFLSNARKRREGGEAGPGGAQGDDSDQELQHFRAQIRGEKNTPASIKRTAESQDESGEEEDGEEESGSEEEEESGDSDEEEDAADGPSGLSLAPDEDESEEEDQRDLELLTVKRRDVFQLEEEVEDDQVSSAQRHPQRQDTGTVYTGTGAVSWHYPGLDVKLPILHLLVGLKDHLLAVETIV